MLNPMEFGGFVIRRIAIRMHYPVGAFRRIFLIS